MSTIAVFPPRNNPGGWSEGASPGGVAVDRAGNVYVSLNADHTIRKISPGGIVTTLAGSAWANGSADGNGGDARFFVPTGIIADPFGNLYVADSLNRTIRRITPDGTVTTLAGAAGESGAVDGPGAAARFQNPRSIAIDSAGNLFVLDADKLRKITDGVVTTLNTTAISPFDSTSYIAVDAAGNIYLTSPNHTVNKGVPVFTRDAESH